MNQILELSAEDKKTGQRKIKIVLHEIHETESRWNKNGITWLESHVQQRIESAVKTPFVAEFFDSDQDMPWGHGTQRMEDGELVFSNSTVVGLIEKAYVERVDVNGKTILAAVAEGILYANRYPNFVNWIETQRANGSPIESSVEIARLPGNAAVVYRDGWKAEGRIPVDFEYIGHAILGITPADDNAILLELNSNKKEDLRMDKQIETLQKLADERLLEINELQGKLSAAEEVVASKETALEEKATELNGLVAEVKELTAKVTELNSAKEAVEVELNTYKEAEAAQKVEELKAEFNEALTRYTEEEKTSAEAEINAFNEAPSAELMSKTVSKLDSVVAQSVLAKRTAELNSKQEKKQTGISEVFAQSNSASDVDIY